MNGTSGKALLEEYETAARAVCSARETLGKATLNGRDYYPQGAAAFEVAKDHRITMMQRLKDIEDELNTILDAISDQVR